MIDFRYHLVSIVSIFLALAVGIVLGAGPLKGELGDTLNKEVAGLRQDKIQLNAQLEEAAPGAEARDAYIADDQPDHAGRTLPERRVALVVLPGSDAAVAEATAATLRSSGAAVVSTTSVSEDWVDHRPGHGHGPRRRGGDGCRRGVGRRLEQRRRSRRATCSWPRCSRCRPRTRSTPCARRHGAARRLDALAKADLIEIDTEGFELADLRRGRRRG